MSNNDTKLQIRHAGNVVIRGRIRRVWRPRRLELTSDGLLLLYDNSNTTTNHTITNNQKQAKYTLSVKSARILDMLSIRDMPIGLPRGTYGFLIRGQRIASDEILNTPSFEVLPMMCSTGESSTPTAGAFRLKDSFVLAEAPEPQPVRDYLCAVDSLEQAQMWVVALQWAAHIQHEEDDHWWKIDYSPSPSARPRPIAEPHRHHQEQTNTTATTTNIPKPPTKTLVTKATNFKFIRTSNFGRYNMITIAYEIHVLSLLVDDSETSPQEDPKTTPVTEWVTYKTKDQLMNISPDAPKLLEKLPNSWWRDWNHLDSAVSIVDSVLRSFTLSTDTVGTLANVLSDNNDVTTTTTTTTRGVRHHETIAADTVDAYVKNWLQARRRKERSYYFHLTRPYSMLVMGGAVAVGLPALRTMWNCSRYVVSLRVDCLVLSWAGAVYLGYRYGAQLNAKLRDETPPHTETITTPILKEEKVGEEEVDDEESEGEAMDDEAGTIIGDQDKNCLSSPLPRYPDNAGNSCWSQPSHDIFHVRGANYFKDKVKIPSGKAPLECIGVDFWLTENPERHIARHPDVLSGRVPDQDTLVVNFLLPFANFVSYFRIPPPNGFPDKLRSVWTKFLKGDQEYRDARLKLLPVVVEGPWIVKTAVGPGKSPALLGKVIPLQYFFRDPTKDGRGMYEIDIIITASSIAKGILSVVKSQTKSVTIAFALIIEAAEQSELPENILCSFQVHSLHLEECPSLRDLNLDDLAQ